MVVNLLMNAIDACAPEGTRHDPHAGPSPRRRASAIVGVRAVTNPDKLARLSARLPAGTAEALA